MQRNFRRSSSGTDLSSACASTRRLNSRACSSRLRKCACWQRGICLGYGLGLAGHEASARLRDSQVTEGEWHTAKRWNITLSARSTSARTASTWPWGAWWTTRSIRSIRSRRRCAWAAASRPTAARPRSRRTARSTRSSASPSAWRGMPREAVRVVGTNALRVAKNAGAVPARAPSRRWVSRSRSSRAARKRASSTSASCTRCRMSSTTAWWWTSAAARPNSSSATS